MSPRKKSNLQLPANYADVLKSIKMRIHLEAELDTVAAKIEDDE